MRTIGVKKYKDTILPCLLVLLALFLRFLCRRYESDDFLTYLDKWVAFYRENGGWRALRYPVGDYNVMYQYILILISYAKGNCLYLIKAVSVVFDFLLALGCAFCTRTLRKGRREQLLCFSVFLLLPTVWLNSAYWGQCDSIYAAFSVWSIYFLMNRRNSLSVLMITLAFAFKLQAVFLLPVFFLFFLKREIKLRHIAIFPLVYILSCLPALAFHKPLAEVLGVYVGQAGSYAFLSLDAPSFPQLLNLTDQNIPVAKYGLMALAFLFALGVCIFLARKKSAEELRLLLPEICAVFAAGIPFLLPCMHERYFYLCGVFAVICLFSYGGKRWVWLLLAEFASLSCYFQYFDWVNRLGGGALSFLFSNVTAALCMLLALLQMTLCLHADAVGEKKKARRRLCVASALAGALLFQIALSPLKLHVYTDGRLVSFCDSQPYIAQDVLWVPMRGYVTASGGDIFFEDGRMCMTNRAGDRIQFKIGSDEATVNGAQIRLHHPNREENAHLFCAAEDLETLTKTTLTYR